MSLFGEHSKCLFLL